MNDFCLFRMRSQLKLLFQNLFSHFISSFSFLSSSTENNRIICITNDWKALFYHSPINRFPRFLGGSPSIAATSGSQLFRAGLCLQTFQIPSHERHPVHPSLFGEDVASATVL